MREAAERRQQLELEHEQALAVLNAKQQEIDLLQKVRGSAAWVLGGGRGVSRGARLWVRAGCSPEACATGPSVPRPWPAKARSALCSPVLSRFPQADSCSCLCCKNKWML